MYYVVVRLGWQCVEEVGVGFQRSESCSHLAKGPLKGIFILGVRYHQASI